MRFLFTAIVVVASLLGSAPDSSAGPRAQCSIIKDADHRNLCLAQQTPGGGVYCSRIRGADLYKFCEATVVRRSAAMCGFIKGAALKAKCRAVLK